MPNPRHRDGTEPEIDRSQLHCYQNDTDTFVASSADEARERFVEHYRAMGGGDDECGKFELLPDDKVIEIRSDFDGKTHRKTCREWVDNPPDWLDFAAGHWFLCSKEF